MKMKMELKKLRKKVMGLTAFVLCLAMLLTACGNGSEPANKTDDGAEKRTPLRITWRNQGDVDPLRDFLEEFIPKFEAENPDIELVLAPIQASEGDYFARVALAMQSPDTAPDIVAQDTFQINADASAGYLLALDDYLNAWEEWEHYTENLKTGVKAADGLLYALPGTSDSRGLWYNKEVFRAAGLDTDWNPTSWEEILETAEVIKASAPDVIPFSFNVARANGEATTMQSFLMFLNGTGEVLYDFDEAKWVTESKGFLDSLEFIDEVFNVRDLAPPASISMNSNYGSVMMQDKFPNGEVGIILDGFWNTGNWIETGAAPLDNVEEVIGFAAMPTQLGQAPGSVTLSGGWGWSIPANSTNHDLSWRVLQGLGSEEEQANRVIAEGNLAVRGDSAENPRYKELPFMEEATKFLENAHFRPANDDYPAVSVEIQMAVEAVASGSSTPEQAMAAYATNVARIAGEENTMSR
jgi:ABC-type sugar transport system, periplasmic component